MRARTKSLWTEVLPWDWRRLRRILGDILLQKAPLVQEAPSSSKENTQTEATVVTEMPTAKAVGGGKKLKHRALVKETMEKHKMKLPEAAIYISRSTTFITRMSNMLSKHLR